MRVRRIERSGMKWKKHIDEEALSSNIHKMIKRMKSIDIVKFNAFKAWKNKKIHTVYQDYIQCLTVWYSTVDTVHHLPSYNYRPNYFARFLNFPFKLSMIVTKDLQFSISITASSQGSEVTSTGSISWIVQPNLKKGFIGENIRIQPACQ